MKFHSLAALALTHLAWASNVIIPAQLGPYPVSIYQHVVQTSRPDPLAPTPQLRQLLITIYRPFLDTFTCPLSHQKHIPWAPPIVASGLLEGFQAGGYNLNISASQLAPLKLLNCTLPISTSTSNASAPLILFQPGYGGVQNGYASLLQAAASSGYTIIAIDPTYEAVAIQFPNGFVAYQSNTTFLLDSNHTGQTFLQSVRIADAISVLDAIQNNTVPYISPSTASRAVTYGHSFGGSAAVNAAYLDSRVLAAANLDGPYYGPVTLNTSFVTKPLFMLQSATRPPVSADWPSFYPNHARGWRTWERVDNTVHYSLTDLPLLADLLGLRAAFGKELTGTVHSQRLQEVLWRFTTEFFGFALRGAEAGLLEGESRGFPDVEFINHAEG